MELCKPSQAILLVGVAGTLYHLVVGDFHGMIWWLLVGIVGTGVFQGLCFGGLEPVGWVLMAIPVLIVCFFLAVALLASRMRIDTVQQVQCDRCGRRHRQGECTMSERECPAVGECRPSGYYWPQKQNPECGCSSDDGNRDREHHRHRGMREDEDLIAHYPLYHKDPDA